MNTHALIDSFKKYSRFQRVEEPKKKAGGLSLVFSGAVFSLLGGSYLYKYAKSMTFRRLWVDLDSSHELSTSHLRKPCGNFVWQKKELRSPFSYLERLLRG